MSANTPPQTLIMRGSLTISRIEAIHAELLESLQAHSAVELDCSDAEEVDVTFLQILIAAHRTAGGLNKTIRLTAPPIGALADALARCGFLPSASATTSLAEVFSLQS